MNPEVRTRPLTKARPLLRLDAASGHLRERSWSVTVESGSDTGVRGLVSPALVVGTSSEAGLALHDSAVSRFHAELVARADGLLVRDLNSTNGTWIRGLRVGEALVEADQPTRIRLGETELLVRVEDVDVGAPEPRTSFGEALGSSTAMKTLFGILEKVAPSDATVLLLGETGTGKDLLARSLHAASGRSGPFVVLDCGAVKADLVESQLFGHVKGAFTGAIADRAGVFEDANAGTLFLDEIGELPIALQSRLLRVLETGSVTRVGSNRPRTVDVRIVAATHRDLDERIAAGEFRQDLYFRLAVVPLHVPALRERPDDICPLADGFARAKGHELELSAELRKRLLAYDWPGNVRELRNFVERSLVGGEVEAPSLRVRDERFHTELPFKAAKDQLFEEFTREYLLKLSRRCQGNVSEMARVAGIARPHLHRLSKKYGIDLREDG